MSDCLIDDPRTRRYLAPTRVVWQQGVENADCLVGNNSGQATLNNAPACRLKHGAGLLLDFGRELHGGVQIICGDFAKENPPRVRVRFGESASETMGEPDNDHAIHDQIVRLPWFGSHEVGNTGFRFVRIDLVDEGTCADLLAVRAVSLMRDLPYLGSFRCSDERLNCIWQTGAYTVHLCMQDYLWDGIKRDRLVWIGDMHPETMVISTVFGEQQIVPQSLDLVRDTTPLPGWMNGISSYSIWWLLIQRDWYRYHGNRGYLEEQRAYLPELLALLQQYIDGEGRETLDGFRFLDWPSCANEGAVHAGLQGLLAMAMAAGAELCDVLEEKAAAAACREAHARLLQHVPVLDPTSKQAASLLALSGLVTAGEANRTVLAQHQLSGLSTFYGYYMLQARALAGDYVGGLEVIRQYWGGMLDAGATSFWEHFDLAWLENAGRIDDLTPEGKKDLHADFGEHCYIGLRHSLCHGWAGGPTAWLTEHMLGIAPLEPGCRVLQVQPHLVDLEFAEGTFPTPHGIVRVRHEQIGDAVKSTIEAPEGVRIVTPLTPKG